MRIFLVIVPILIFGQCKSQLNMDSGSHQFSNSLIGETSPYLQQHAHNPVNWYPWSQEALEKAQKENKLLIISIGYSACHWCHVMEQESFEDSTVAVLMNENFVSIKVDREERPDIDDIYMTACNLVTGRGGWPLNAVALPDGRPIWAGTYFPKEEWLDILTQFAALKDKEYPRLVETAEKLLAGVQEIDKVIDVSPEIEFEAEDLQKIGMDFISNIDFQLGGLKSSQKFPLPSNYDFLLKYAYKFPESRAIEAVEITLGAMMSGGIYDHVEGGFSRYTVDPHWKVPHFEKMLYDNAQLIGLYAQAYRSKKKDDYKRTVEESIRFMKTNWKDDSGGYYSSFDADSEGVEGKFYVWTMKELASIIPSEDFDAFCDYYNITEQGNWEGKNILFLDPHRASESPEFLEKRDNWRSLLLMKRKTRIYPGLDDKIICAWNAMLLNGFAEAYKAFGNEDYRDEAINIWKFIEENLLDTDGLRLNRTFKEGRSNINAFLDDYAQVIAGLINLYQITFDEVYLHKADAMQKYVIDHFKSETSSMFNFTSDIDPPLIVDKAEVTDGAVPASNSTTAINLNTLGHFLYNNEYLQLSKQMLRNMKSTINKTNQPNFYSNWCSLYFDMVYEPYEVAILGPNYDRISAEMMTEYHPNALFLGGGKEGSMKLLENKLQVGEDFIYVCVNKSCKLPVQSAVDALLLID